MASQVTFGRSGLSRPTPAGVSSIIDVVSGICGVIITWMVTATFIPNNVSNIISSILGLLIGISQVVKPLFGLKTDMSKVNIEDVTSMEQPTEKP